MKFKVILLIFESWIWESSLYYRFVNGVIYALSKCVLNECIHGHVKTCSFNRLRVCGIVILIWIYYMVLLPLRIQDLLVQG